MSIRLRIRIILGFVFLQLAVIPAALASYTTLVDNGPSSNRVDIIFLGDGYTATDLADGIYYDDITGYLDYMFADTLISDPFYRYRNFFNVHAIEVVSNESGADIPPEGIFRDTALNATYYGDGETERALVVNDMKADKARSAALEGAPFTAEMQFVTVNDSKYGGTGGDWAVYAGGNSEAHEIALHEIAHTFSGVADEYGGYETAYTGTEPHEVNVTKDPDGAKWSQWLGYEQPGIGTIGAYEGARYYDFGVYRPSEDSKMRSLNQPFDAITREKIILDIYKRVNPFDDWTDNGLPLTDPGALTVDLVDDEVLGVEWFVDDVLVPNATDASFELSDYGFGLGSYSVTARGYDPTAFDPVDGWVRKTPQQLEQFISWDVTLTTIPLNGDFDLDGDVDGSDFLLWQRDPGVGDLADWQANYGSVSSIANTHAVPEPSGSLLITVLAFGTISSRRRI